MTLESAPAPVRAVIYLRVSTERQVKEGTSLDSQEAVCLRKAKEMGAFVVRILRDEGVSGGLLLARPGVRAALELLEDGSANALICAELSRLTRDLEHQQQFFRRIRAARAQLVLCTGEISDTAESEFSLDVQGAANKYQRRKLREKTMEGRKQNARQGKQVFRRFSPWGYHLPTKAEVMRHTYTEAQLGKYLVVEDEAVYVRELFQRCAAGSSLSQLAAWLNDADVPTRNGAASWSRVTIRAILINPVYKGTAMFGRREAVFSEERTAQHPTGKRQYSLRSRDEADCVPIAVEPLVSEATWQAANQRLKENKARLSGNPERRSMLSGMVICPECGYRMTARPTSSGRYYGCHNNRSTCTYRHEEPAVRIEGAVTRAVIRMVDDPAFIQAALEAFHSRTNTRPGKSVAQLEKEIAALDRKERATVQAQIRGVQAGADPGLYDKEFQAISEQRQQLRELAVFTQAADRRTILDEPGAIEVLRAAAADVREVLHSEVLTPGEKNQALRVILHSVHIEKPGRYRLQLGEASGTRVTVNQAFVCLTVTAAA